MMFFLDVFRGCSTQSEGIFLPLLGTGKVDRLALGPLARESAEDTEGTESTGAPDDTEDER